MPKGGAGAVTWVQVTPSALCQTSFRLALSKPPTTYISPLKTLAPMPRRAVLKAAPVA